MVRTAFHVSFLFAVPYLKDVPKQKKKKTAKVPKVKKKKSKKSVQEIPEEVVVPVVEDQTPVPYNGQIDVNKPTVFVHVEYEVISAILLYDLDIVCYGDVAKIYTRDGNASVKTIVRENVAWIAFTVDHNIHLSDELLVELHATIVTFNVWTDKKKQFKTTQQDNPRRFYAHEEFAEATFVPLEERDMNDNPVSTEVELPNLSVLVNNSLRAVPYPDHRRTIEALVNLHSENIQIVAAEAGGKKKKKGKKGKIKEEEEVKKDEDIDTDESEDEDGGKKKKKKGKKDKKAKKSPLAGSEQLTMLGEVFLGNIWEMKAEKTFETLSIPYMAVISTVCDVFVLDQLNYFNPVVVQMREVNNVPVKLFQEYGFEWVYMKYTLPNGLEYETEKKRVDKFIAFNDTRVMLTHDQDATKFMEFVLTKFLRIQMWGVREERFCGSKVPSEVFRFTDSNRCMQSRLLPDPFSQPFSKTDSEAVRYVSDKASKNICLGEMEMDISALATNQLLVESTNTFRRPRAQHEYSATSGCWAYYNLPDVHEPCRSESVNTSPFTDYMLQRTTADVALKVLAPLTSIMMDVYTSKEHYNRLIIVIDSKLESQLCTDIIEEIYRTNLPFVSALKPPNDLYYARKEFLRPHDGEWSEKITEELQGKQHFYQSRRGMFHTPVFGRSAVTGFILDNCDRVLIVLEGRNQSSLLKIYCFLEELDATTGFVVHYNSEMAFKSRLYADFLEMGGIMVITMDEPVEVKQMRKQFLLTRSTGAPSRAVQTINKLNNLFSVRDIATASRQDFFPTAAHLVSFAVEFGVPFRLIDSYTEMPTPLNEAMGSCLNIEELWAKLEEDEDHESVEIPVKRRSSTGFTATEIGVNMDMFGNTYNTQPGGFTLVHACSSALDKCLVTEYVSTTNINAPTPVVPVMRWSAAAPEPDVTRPDDGEVDRGSPVKDETFFDEEHSISDIIKAIRPPSVDRRTSLKKPTRSKKPSVAYSVLQDDIQQPQQQGDTPKPSPKIWDPDAYVFGVDISGLVLPRRPNQTLDQRREAIEKKPSKKTPPEPPCPLQEKYFRDFYSGTDVTRHKRGERKAKRSVKRPDGSRAKSVHKKRTAKPALDEKPSEEHFFPHDSDSENLEDVELPATENPSNENVYVHRKKKKSKKILDKKLVTPPEPACPLQGYFRDYYESNTVSTIIDTGP